MERSSASSMTSSSEVGRFNDIVALHQCAATLRSGAATLRHWGGHASPVGRPRFPHSRKIAFPSRSRGRIDVKLHGKLGGIGHGEP
jgi:hypothetical protein